VADEVAAVDGPICRADAGPEGSREDDGHRGHGPGSLDGTLRQLAGGKRLRWRLSGRRRPCRWEPDPSEPPSEEWEELEVV